MARKPQKSKSRIRPGAATQKNPVALPQNTNAWYCAVRKLHTWVQENEDQFIQPILALVVEQESGMILDVDMLKELPEPLFLQRKLFGLMAKPPRKFGFKPHRPAEIHFEDEALAGVMGPLLAEVGVMALYRPQPERVDEIIEMLQANVLGEERPIPGLFAQPGVTPELVGEMFAAALDFHRAEPWVSLENEDLLAIQVGEQAEPYYVMVMGAGGEEYGLSLSRSLQELETFFSATSPEDILQGSGQDAFLFNQPPYISFDDLEAIQRYGWELPAPDMVPTPWTVKDEGIARPDAGMLKWYVAALQAIAVFTQEHLKTNPDGTHPAVTALIDVETGEGRQAVTIRYPGADLSRMENRLELRIAWTGDEDEDEDDEDYEPPVLFDRRIMEGDMARLAASLGGIAETQDPRLAEAQERMYAAFEERSPARRIALAKDALEISPDCADAYVLLAQEEAATTRQAHDLFQQGVAAGRRALGEAFFKDRENIGHFWGILATRPYMRAMQGLAYTSWELGQREEALKIYREMLRLNPGDNQGIRDEMLTLLIEMGRDEEAAKLLRKYKGDYTASWLFGAALVAFRMKGDHLDARMAIQNALGANRRVADYLTGKKRVPALRPESYSLGSDDEAILYVGANLGVWRRTPGAVEWLKAQAQRKP
jgi:tetratricopeptide (TPR) repeat protein